jgi:hypothetical protein
MSWERERGKRDAERCGEIVDESCRTARIGATAMVMRRHRERFMRERKASSPRHGDA